MAKRLARSTSRGFARQ